MAGYLNPAIGRVWQSPQFSIASVVRGVLSFLVIIINLTYIARLGSLVAAITRRIEGRSHNLVRTRCTSTSFPHNRGGRGGGGGRIWVGLG